MTTHGGYCDAPDCDEISAMPLCAACAARLRVSLRLVIDLGLGVELATATGRGARLARPGDSARRGTEAPLPYDEDAARVATALHSTLVMSVRDIAAKLGHDTAGPVCAECAEAVECVHGSCRAARGAGLPDDSPDDLARWLLDHLPDIRRSDAGGLIADEIPAVVAEAERTIDLPTSTVLAGECPACASPVYAMAGAPRGYCRTPGCTGELRVAEGRLDQLDRLDEQQLGAADAARVMTALGEPVTRHQINQWHARGTITPSRWERPRSTSGRQTVDHPGRPLYRIGDVRARRRASLSGRNTAA